MIRRYIRAITRQSLDEWSRLELAITAAVTCLGLPYLALVIVAVGSEARYALDGSVAMGHIVSTRVSGRNAQNIDVTYSFVTADGQSRIGNASTPTDWHVAKDPITVELLRSDPDVNRPYYDGRILDELPRESVTLGFALSMFAISLFPWLGHRWRDRLERELRRSGARASATVESVKPFAQLSRGDRHVPIVHMFDQLINRKPRKFKAIRTRCRATNSPCLRIDRSCRIY